MQCMNGILILSEDEKEVLEADIGPISSYDVHDIRLKLVNVIERKEAEGCHQWARMIRPMLEEISAFADSSG